MTTRTATISGSTAFAMPDPTHHRLPLADGTTIDFLRLGTGPGIVVLHGAMESAASHLGLARALSGAHTVLLPERRGHRAQGVGPAYGIREEVADVLALLEHSGADTVFGVSSGGLIALEAALASDRVRRVVVYEPALVTDGQIDASLLARYERELGDGRVAAALLTGMQVARLGPAIFNLIPRFLLERFTASAMRSEDRTAKPGDVTMRMLAPTLHADFALVAEEVGRQSRFAAIAVPTLLLRGSKSPAWLRAAVGVLGGIIPGAQVATFDGLDHGGSSDRCTTNRGGDPGRVADEVRRFVR